MYPDRICKSLMNPNSVEGRRGWQRNTLKFNLAHRSLSDFDLHCCEVSGSGLGTKLGSQTTLHRQKTIVYLLLTHLPLLLIRFYVGPQLNKENNRKKWKHGRKDKRETNRMGYIQCYVRREREEEEEEGGRSRRRLSTTHYVRWLSQSQI